MSLHICLLYEQIITLTNEKKNQQLVRRNISCHNVLYTIIRDERNCLAAAASPSTALLPHRLPRTSVALPRIRYDDDDDDNCTKMKHAHPHVCRAKIFPRWHVEHNTCTVKEKHQSHILHTGEKNTHIKKEKNKWNKCILNIYYNGYTHSFQLCLTISPSPSPALFFFWMRGPCCSKCKTKRWKNRCSYLSWQAQ